MLGRQRGRSVVARVTSAAQGWVQAGQGHSGYPGKAQAARSVWTGVAGHGRSVRGQGVPYLPGSPAGGFAGVGVRRGARGGRSSRTATVHGPRRSHAAHGPVWAPGGACAPCLLVECSVILRPALWVSQLLVPSPSNICKESRGFCTGRPLARMAGGGRAGSVPAPAGVTAAAGWAALWGSPWPRPREAPRAHASAEKQFSGICSSPERPPGRTPPLLWVWEA